MDEYRENAKKVQMALNQDAAFIQPDPYLAQRVLNTANAESVRKGGFGLHRKTSFSLILVIVLIMLTITAVAAVLLSMRDIVEDRVIPMAQEYEGDSLPADSTEAILMLAEENGIFISQEGKERIEFALMQDNMYYKDELVRELAKTEFGEDPLQWTLEQQKWYTDVCTALGISGGTESILPENAEYKTDQAIGWAKAHIHAQHGTPTTMLNEDNYIIGVQCTNGCEEVAYLGMCWTVWFTPRVLEYNEYVVHMDENGTVLALTNRPGLSANSNVNDIYHAYEKIYGSLSNWGQRELNSFREVVLKSPDTNHQAYLCMMNTSYPDAVPENAIEKDVAIHIATEYLGVDTYIVTTQHLINTDKNPVWKLRVNAGAEQWSFEIDCFSGEICTVRQIGFGDTKWWMPIVLWEVVDEVRENWVDTSPSVG